MKRKILTWSREAFGKRVTGVSNIADAYGAVVDHLALGVDSARVHARRRAFLIDAREFSGALGVHHALGSTTRRGSDEIRQAGAHGVVVHVSTLAIGPARSRATRV